MTFAQARRSPLLTTLVLVSAALQALVVGSFAAASLSGDSLGIFHALALGLAAPFVALTLPALVLLARGRPGAAALLAAGALPVSWLLWWTA